MSHLSASAASEFTPPCHLEWRDPAFSAPGREFFCQAREAIFTGGSFGPEAGLMGIAAAVLGILLLVLYVKRANHVAGQLPVIASGS